jgi:hypothetical protein
MVWNRVNLFSREGMIWNTVNIFSRGLMAWNRANLFSRDGISRGGSMSFFVELLNRASLCSHRFISEQLPLHLTWKCAETVNCPKPSRVDLFPGIGMIQI